MEININITLGATADLLAALRSLRGKETEEYITAPVTAPLLINDIQPIPTYEMTEPEKPAPAPKPKKPRGVAVDAPAPGYRRMAGWMKIMGKTPTMSPSLPTSSTRPSRTQACP